MKKSTARLRRDKALILWSIIIAAALSYYGIFHALIEASMQYLMFANLMAGVMFTSLFTLAPATVAFIELSEVQPLMPIVIAGASGAVLGDLFLYLFVRDTISDDIALMMSRRWRHRLGALLHHRALSWAVPIVGALIIASPLPDELGIALMGLSKTRLVVLLPISFCMNALGIALIWLGVHTL